MRLRRVFTVGATVRALRRLSADYSAAYSAAHCTASCVACGLAPGDPFCAGCEEDFAPATVARCAQCAAPMPSGATPRCGQCLAHPPHFDATVALADYQAPVDAMVLALKSGARLDLGPALGRLLARRAAPIIAPGTLIIPVPLAFERLRERGFNQALELARPIARTLRQTLAVDVVARVRHGAPQQALDRAKRRANLAGAFVARAPLGDRTVVLVDDVLTTGATLDALAAVVKKAGAVRVTNLIVARTP
jgi:ComF family protein